MERVDVVSKRPIGGINGSSLSAWSKMTVPITSRYILCSLVLAA